MSASWQGPARRLGRNRRAKRGADRGDGRMKMDAATPAGEAVGFDEEVDLLVFGAGAGGMTAALTGAIAGLGDDPPVRALIRTILVTLLPLDESEHANGRVALAFHAHAATRRDAAKHLGDDTAGLRGFIADQLRGAQVAGMADLRAQLLHDQARMGTAMNRLIKSSRQTLSALSSKRVLQSPVNYLEDKRMQLDYSQKQLIAASRQLLANKRQGFIRLTSALDAMSPLKVLGRGYSIVKGESGSVIQSASEVSLGQRIHVRMRQGSLVAAVEQIQEENSDG